MGCSSSVIVSVLQLLVVVLGSVLVVDGSTYATNLNTISVGSTGAKLTWSVPSDLSVAVAYILTVDDERLTTVVNININDVQTTSYTLTGLHYSMYHNATIVTIDASNQVVGKCSIYFLTDYDPVNFHALCAIGVVGGIFLVLIFVKVAAKVCNPDHGAEKWKQEVLEIKKQQRDEKKKKKKEKRISNMPFPGPNLV